MAGHVSTAIGEDGSIIDTIDLVSRKEMISTREMAQKSINIVRDVAVIDCVNILIEESARNMIGYELKGAVYKDRDNAYLIDFAVTTNTGMEQGDLTMGSKEPVSV